MSTIKRIQAYQALDSRGNPTVGVHLIANGTHVDALVPSGASTGKHEALELRDGGSRFRGKGVTKAVGHVNKEIAKRIVGMDCAQQEDIDNAMIELDGTEHKEKLGANAMLGVSLAVCKAGALANKVPLYQHIQHLSNTKQLSLPVPQLNVINSGKHAGIENDIQEHMYLPTDFPTFSEALRAGVETYHTLAAMRKEKFGVPGILLGDEGGFAALFANVRERLELMMNAIEKAGYEKKIKLGLDAASSEFFHKGTYKIREKSYTPGELIDLYKDLQKTYPIITIEDGMAEDDWKGWQQLQKELGSKIQLVGDDLLVTNQKRMKKAIDSNACNALLLKVNQIGTVTESIQAATLAHQHKWNVVVSHRSGETEDSFIADMVVGLGAAQSKFGAPARGERTAKYNRLLEIEQELGSKGFFKKNA